MFWYKIKYKPFVVHAFPLFQFTPWVVSVHLFEFLPHWPHCSLLPDSVKLYLWWVRCRENKSVPVVSGQLWCERIIMCAQCTTVHCALCTSHSAWQCCGLCTPVLTTVNSYSKTNTTESEDMRGQIKHSYLLQQTRKTVRNVGIVVVFTKFFSKTWTVD